MPYSAFPSERAARLACSPTAHEASALPPSLFSTAAAPFCPPQPYPTLDHNLTCPPQSTHNHNHNSQPPSPPAPIPSSFFFLSFFRRQHPLCSMVFE